MKYLFVNSVAGFGSTGRIVAEKCRELMAQGHECLIGYGRDKVNCDDIPTLCIGSPFDYRVHGVMSRVFDNHGFGSKTATKRFLEQVKLYDPDVIWLHNLHGYYINVELLFNYLRTCGKKIFWTLHDCWSFTGHCSYFDFIGCDRWKTGCLECPQKNEYPASLFLDNSQKNFAEKKRLFSGIPDLTIVTVSHWLEKRVKQSFLGDYPVDVVYNTVNTDVFKPTQSDFREKFQLDDKKLILGVASVWEKRKGLDDFIALSKMLDTAYQIVLVGLSAEQSADLPANILSLPRTNSVAELAEIYSAADVYLCPSVEETFGMTVLEAVCCGTPAIVYTDTACEEVVQQYGGIAVPRGVENLYRAIIDTFSQSITEE